MAEKQPARGQPGSAHGGQIADGDRDQLYFTICCQPSQLVDGVSAAARPRPLSFVVVGVSQ